MSGQSASIPGFRVIAGSALPEGAAPAVIDEEKKSDKASEPLIDVKVLEQLNKLLENLYSEYSEALKDPDYDIQPDASRFFERRMLAKHYNVFIKVNLILDPKNTLLITKYRLKLQALGLKPYQEACAIAEAETVMGSVQQALVSYQKAIAQAKYKDAYICGSYADFCALSPSSSGLARDLYSSAIVLAEKELSNPAFAQMWKKKLAYWYQRRGESYGIANNEELALKDFDSAKNLLAEGSRETIYFRLAETLIEMKQYDQGLGYVEKCLALNAKHPLAHTVKIKALYHRFAWRITPALLDEVLSGKKELSSDSSTEISTIIKAADIALQYSTDKSAVYQTRGSLHITLHQKTEAQADFIQAILLARTPEDRKRLMTLNIKVIGDTLKTTLAEEMRKLTPQIKSAELKEEKTEAIKEGNVSEEKLADVMKSYHRQITSYSQTVLLKVNLSEVLRKEKNYAAALAKANEALLFDRHCTMAHVARCLANFALGNYKVALTDASNVQRLSDHYGLQFVQIIKEMVDYNKRRNQPQQTNTGSAIEDLADRPSQTGTRVRGRRRRGRGNVNPLSGVKPDQAGDEKKQQTDLGEDAKTEVNADVNVVQGAKVADANPVEGAKVIEDDIVMRQYVEPDLFQILKMQYAASQSPTPTLQYDNTAKPKQNGGQLAVHSIWQTNGKPVVGARVAAASAGVSGVLPVNSDITETPAESKLKIELATVVSVPLLQPSSTVVAITESAPPVLQNDPKPVVNLGTTETVAESKLEIQLTSLPQLSPTVVEPLPPVLQDDPRPSVNSEKKAEVIEVKISQNPTTTDVMSEAKIFFTQLSQKIHHPKTVSAGLVDEKKFAENLQAYLINKKYKSTEMSNYLYQLFSRRPLLSVFVELEQKNLIPVIFPELAMINSWSIQNLKVRLSRFDRALTTNTELQVYNQFSLVLMASVAEDFCPQVREKVLNGICSTDTASILQFGVSDIKLLVAYQAENARIKDENRVRRAMVQRAQTQFFPRVHSATPSFAPGPSAGVFNAAPEASAPYYYYKY